MNLREDLKDQNISGIVYLNEHESISTLLVTKPEFFIVKIKEEKCIIY